MVKLVLGGSGFLGSHVTRQLVDRGERVRVLLRESSPTRGLEGLDVERRYGSVFDPATLRAALDGVDDVFYGVVDTRAWLRDPAPLFATNVDGLRTVLDVVASADIHRFVFTSSLATLAIDAERRPVTEDQPHNWGDVGGDYVRSRVQAEELVLAAARDGSVPAVSMCVANTYGPGDFQPTPHGTFVLLAAKGRLPFYIRGAASEVVPVDSAAEALVLAADKGRIGERYAVSERWMTSRELLEIAADEGGVRPPRLGIPIPVMAGAGMVGEQVARLARRDLALTRTSVRLMHVMTPLDRTKASRELGWTPRPTPDAIRDAARFYLSVRPSSESG